MLFTDGGNEANVNRVLFIDVRPCDTAMDHANRALANTEHAGNVTLLHAALQFPLDANDGIRGQLMWAVLNLTANIAVCFPVAMSLLCDHILGIIFHRPNK